MTLLSLWALLPSPLMVGAALPDNDPWTRALLTNPEVLAVNQDSLGAAARRVSSQDDADVWVKDLADGSKAVGIFNRGDLPMPVTARWSALGLSGRHAVRDLWRRRALAPAASGVTLSVPPHGVDLLKVSR